MDTPRLLGGEAPPVEHYDRWMKEEDRAQAGEWVPPGTSVPNTYDTEPEEDDDWLEPEEDE